MRCPKCKEEYDLYTAAELGTCPCGQPFDIYNVEEDGENED